MSPADTELVGRGPKAPGVALCVQLGADDRRASTSLENYKRVKVPCLLFVVGIVPRVGGEGSDNAHVICLRARKKPVSGLEHTSSSRPLNVHADVSLSRAAAGQWIRIQNASVQNSGCFRTPLAQGALS